MKNELDEKDGRRPQSAAPRWFYSKEERMLPDADGNLLCATISKCRLRVMA